MKTRIVLVAFFLACSSLSLFAQGTPPTPTNLNTNVVTGPAIELTWESPVGLWAFKVYRSAGDNQHFAAVGLPLMNRKFFDNMVLPGTTYYYYVTAVAQDMTESNPSNTSSVTLPADPSAGIVTGLVTTDGTGQPIANVTIRFVRVDVQDEWQVLVPTNGEGHYETTLDTGTYVIRAEPPWISGYQAEWYDNALDSVAATPVKVAGGATFTANFGLARKSAAAGPHGTISGLVTDASSTQPVANVVIRFYRTSSMPHWQPSVMTDTEGHFTAEVDTGTYLVAAQPPMGTMVVAGYMLEWFDNAKDPAHAASLQVTEGSTLTADFALDKVVLPPTVAIKGMVTDTTGNPLANATVAFMRTPLDIPQIPVMTGTMPRFEEGGLDIEGFGHVPGVLWRGLSDSSGKYTATVISGLSYIGMAAKPGFLPEFYNDQVAATLADRITPDKDVSNIDFSLMPLPEYTSSISGMVKDSASNGVPARIVIIALRAGPPPMVVRSVNTTTGGLYTVENLHAGEYLILAIPYSEFAPAFYKQNTFGEIHWRDAERVTVNGATTGIDIGVVPIVALGLTRISGRATTGTGSPTVGGNVFAIAPSGRILGYGVTDPSGNYAIDGVPEGAVTITADKEGFEGTSSTIQVPTGGYSVENVDLTMTTVTSVSSHDVVPAKFALEQNWPNPWNPSTTIGYTVGGIGDQGSGARNVKLTVYNLLGQEVATLVNEKQAPGRYTVRFDGSRLASGVYLYRLQAGSYVETKRMVLVR